MKKNMLDGRWFGSDECVMSAVRAEEMGITKYKTEENKRPVKRKTRKMKCE
jgi:hypothetical protein